jgi:hypothetical protein
MRPKGATYTVVENAGYEDEHDVKSGFRNLQDAYHWAEAAYTRGDYDRLHVQVRRDSPDGEQTYEY